ncbi:YTH domain-containing protein [Mycena pura]|uniref:YTH domain-containing protein n=1 Tax=Mycena pura TaxID=153505 RepID=A0AAD6UZU3_9AGAR|nr:YTH domain-containing protein [Mycena pura]
MGMHKQWVQALGGATQQLPESASPASSSSSDASTSSSLLAQHFPDRFFILKSLTQDALDQSVRRGVWATQQHNAGVLARAFRTAANVFCVFSVNKSGQFYGYARMTGPLSSGDGEREHRVQCEWPGPGRAVDDAPGRRHPEPSPSPGAHGATASARPAAPQLLSEGHVMQRSPLALSPSSSPQEHSQASGQQQGQGQEQRPNNMQSAPAVLETPHQRLSHSAMSLGRGHSLDHARGPVRGAGARGGTGVHPAHLSRSPRTVETPPPPPPSSLAWDSQDDTQASAGAEQDAAFPLQWLCTARLPFTHTRHLHNPWNRGRPVKIARDGTELEPAVGRALLAAWSTAGAGRGPTRSDRGGT